MKKALKGLLKALLVLLVAGIAGFLAGALSGCSSLEPEMATTTMCGIKVSVPVPEFETDCYNDWRPAICEYFEVLVENEDWGTLQSKLRLMRRDRELYVAFATLLNYQDMELLKEESNLQDWIEHCIKSSGAQGGVPLFRVDTMVLWVYLQSKEFHRCLVYYDKLSVKTEADELIASVARARLDM